MLSTEHAREVQAVDDALAGRPVAADLHPIATLVSDVRTLAPAMRPEFTQELDELRRAGFPRRGPTSRSGPVIDPRGRPGGDPSATHAPASEPRSRPRRRLGLVIGPTVAGLAAVAVLAVALTSQSGHGPSSGPSLEQSARSATAASSGAGSPAQSPAAAAPTAAPAAGGASSGSSVRQIERGVTLGLGVAPDHLQSTADRVVQTVGEFDGTVASSSVTSAEQGGGEAVFELTVPSDSSDVVVAALSALGHVQSLNRDTLDITDPVTSARERVSALRALRDGVLRQLARGSTPAQTDAARARLGVIAGQLDGARAALAQLLGRADRARIHLTIQGISPQTGGTNGAWTPTDALGSSLHVLEVTADVLLVGLSFLVPFGLLLSLPLIAARLRRRRRREQALAAS